MQNIIYNMLSLIKKKNQTLNVCFFVLFCFSLYSHSAQLVEWNLVSRLGIEPVSSAMKMQSLNYWTAEFVF